MNARFTHDAGPAGTELRLEAPDGPIPVDLWAVRAPPALLRGVDVAQRLQAAESAIADGPLLLVEHGTVAGLTLRDAASLGLPPPAPLRAVVEGSGLLTKPDFRATLTWQRLTGQAILGAVRVGAWLRVGGELQRLPASLFEIAEAVDRLSAVSNDDIAGKLAAIAGLRDVLPAAEAQGEASARGMLGRITIVQADAFSLDLRGEGEDAKLLPILHRGGADPATPALPDTQQRAFGEDQFHRFGAARPVYTLGDGWIVVLAPPLRRALAEVRRVSAAPAATRRAFFAAPRAFLRKALGDDVDDTVLERVFQETAGWSDRVVGLGLWQKRVLPWVNLPTTDWLGAGGDGSEDVRASRTPTSGITVAGRRISLSRDAAIALQAQVESAIGAGHAVVEVMVEGERIELPADHATLAALHAAEVAGTTPPQPDSKAALTAEVLVIHANEEEVELEADFTPRSGIAPAVPARLKTPPKEHQAEGITWLQQAWLRGLPGVLLADDMGLGKTLQGLAFLAWLRQGMEAGSIAKAPILVVAPTGLLENWRAEHDRHLTSPGLGRCLQAYGKGLGAIRTLDADGRPGLDERQLRDADWVLTTYETLRDHDRDFGRVRFAALLFDEAQKIKTPGVRLTDAAKAMDAEFRIAMTGTPVENRLADLWCIVDTVHPGCLEDLKSFSARFERDPNVETLQRLKTSLDTGFGGRPALLLRRMKEEKLKDLPSRDEQAVSEEMSGAQLAAYEATIQQARGADRRGAMLEALQRLRQISLHPDVTAAASDDAFIAASARLRVGVGALDRIAERGERALVFVDDLEMQARLTGVLQRRYRLAAPPMVINGTVDGRARQARVDRFQAMADGFGVMVLSPRAGGVGLTLTSANHVVHLSRWWNPAVEDQCTGRVLRIGQARPVTIHIPMAVLPGERRSFDENLHSLLERKRKLMRDALMPPVETEAERAELFARTVG